MARPSTRPSRPQPVRRLSVVVADPRLVPVAGAGGVLALAGFWLLTLLAGRGEPGYDPTRDYVSSLASHGAAHPALGIVAIVLFGVSYLCAGHVLLRHQRAVALALLVGGAGLVTLVVAAARIDCPGGAARCGLRTDVGEYVTRLDVASWGQVVHGPAVSVSYALVLASMLLLAVRAGRRRPTAYVSVGAALLSAVSPAFWLPSTQPGLGQRFWLLVLTGWILWVCLLALLTDPVEPEDAP